MNISTRPDYEYHPHILPDDCAWVGAIASADGYNGHSYVANVCQDTNQVLWVFAERGRFRIDSDEFNRKRISNQALAGAPHKFNPINLIKGVSDA